MTIIYISIQLTVMFNKINYFKKYISCTLVYYIYIYYVYLKYILIKLAVYLYNINQDVPMTNRFCAIYNISFFFWQVLFFIIVTINLY